MGPEGLPRDWAQEAHHLAVAPHLLLDVKIDLVPNLHSVAKSAGSWVQEKIERDTAALNLHSSYWRNATGPLEQYHNERPPAPETKTFQGWHGHRSYIKLNMDHPNLHISSRLGRVGRAGGHTAELRVPDTGEKR